MDFVEFPIEFRSSVDVNEEIRADIEERLLKLAGDRTDMIRAAVSISEPGQSEEQTFLYQARIVVFMRPDSVAADKKDDTIEGALKSAMNAIERQVREQRKKRGEPWKRPDISDGPGR